MIAQNAAPTPAIAMPEAAVRKVTTAGIWPAGSSRAAFSDAANVPNSASPATAAMTPAGASSTRVPKNA